MGWDLNFGLEPKLKAMSHFFCALYIAFIRRRSIYRRSQPGFFWLNLIMTSRKEIQTYLDIELHTSGGGVEDQNSIPIMLTTFNLDPLDRAIEEPRLMYV